MKTETAKEWLKENDLPDAMIRTSGNQVLFRTSDAMQAYADQQVNRVLDEAIEKFSKKEDKAQRQFDSITEYTYKDAIYILESLKIKQP